MSARSRSLGERGADRPVRHGELGRDLLRARAGESRAARTAGRCPTADDRRRRETSARAAASRRSAPRSGRIFQSEGRTTEPMKATSRQPSCSASPQKAAELPDPGPVMRIGGNPLRIRPFAQREQHDTPAAPDGGVGQRKRQGSAAANDGERGLAVRRLRHRRAHGAASASALRSPQRGHHRRALAAFADEGHDFSDHRIAGKLRARCAAGARRTCPRRRTASDRRRGCDADRSRLNLRRLSPTTLSPTRTAFGPNANPNGMTSRVIPLMPPSIAPSPTRTNWCTAVLPPMNTWLAIETWPPSTAPLAKVTSSPTWQS